MDQDRLARKFQQIDKEGRTGLILFLTAGSPDLDSTLKLVPALVDAGADCIELGFPFSDPLADGLTIQASSFQALNNGVTLAGCLELVEQIRDQVPDTPIILFGYYNPVLQYGISKFAQEAHRVGADGVIVADLPPEETGPLAKECSPLGIHVIPLLAPTSTDARIESACRTASGFVYCLTLTGVTGVRDDLPPGVFDLLKRVRKHTQLPLAVGFGISRREHIESISGAAQAAAVGSALVKLIMESSQDQLVNNAQEYVRELSGHGSTSKGEALR